MWHQIGSLGDFQPGTLSPYRFEEFRLVIVRTHEGKIHALDQQCPHEGYSLCQGNLDGSTLTCCWHNWKFDVRDGSCLIGGEGTRAYGVRETGGFIEVNLTRPNPEEELESRQKSVREGLFRGDIGRVLRDVSRLLKSGVAPRRILLELAHYDALHAEWGSSHVLALAADCFGLCDSTNSHEQNGALLNERNLLAIAQVVELCSEQCRRMPERSKALANVEGQFEDLLESLEKEDGARAEGILRSALQNGLSVEEGGRWLYRLMSQHFTDFGHQLIFLVKSQELMDGSADPNLSHDILASLLYSTIMATREDRLPYLASYFDTQVEGSSTSVYMEGALKDAVLNSTKKNALSVFQSAISLNVDRIKLAKELVSAGAHRLLRFNLKHDSDPHVAEGWLWATHRFTFAAAVRHAIEKWGGSEVDLYLRQAVAFIHSGKAMDDPLEAERGAEFHPNPEATPLSTLQCVRSGRVSEAMEACVSVLEDEKARIELQRLLEDYLLEDVFNLPIFAAHGIKVLVAAFEEREALGSSDDRNIPVLAAIRFIASPVSERRLNARSQSALRWVRDSVMPRKLTQ